MDRSEWLAALKVGDQVEEHTGHLYPNIERVGYIKSSGIQLVTRYGSNGNRYRKSDGVLFGSKDESLRICPISQEVQDREDSSRICWKLNYIKWGELPVETLREVLALVEAAKKEGA